MRMRWEAAQLRSVSDVVAAARSAHPTLMTLIGESGMGKTSLLREVVQEAAGFNVLEGDGQQEGYRDAYSVLRQLGVDDVLAPSGRPKDPLIAAQALQGLVDELSPSGPVLIVVDDLQWVDRESIETLYWLIHRARGDRLLLVVASRPEDDQTSDNWRRLMRQAAPGAKVSLTGVTLEQALLIARGVEDTADDATVRRVWEHTGGNPFHLRSLLKEFTVPDLAAMRKLPAPAELTGRLRSRLAVFPPDVVTMSHAVAVLGDGWHEVPVLAAVGGVLDPATAVQELSAAGLLLSRETELTLTVRTPHALIGAATYQSIPYARRRELHRQAAEQLVDPMERLEHRVAATDRQDVQLASELQDTASAAHLAGDFRRAGQLFRWSSGLTADPTVRNRRWLEGVFDMILDRDMAAVRQQLPAVRSAPDLARRALIQGLILTVEKRWLEALVTYSSVTEDLLGKTDSRTRYRLLTMTAWSMVGVGRSTADVAGLLTRAAAEPDRDPALIGYTEFAVGMMSLRRRDEVAFDAIFDAIPTSPSATPLPLTYKLAWRGSVWAMWGEAMLAEADLLEMTLRIRSGIADNADGVYNGLLAFTRWQRGAWSMARSEMGLALDSAIGQPHPMNRAIEPMLLAVIGDFERADDRLRQAEDVLRVMPWREAAHLFVISYVARLHAGGDQGDQRGGLDHLRHIFGDDILRVPGFTGTVWTFHLAIAAVWARDLRQAESLLGEVAIQPRPPAWTGWIDGWIRGLIAEAKHETAQAYSLMTAAAGQITDELPLYQAHLLADHARIADLVGQQDGADRSRVRSRQLYRMLGATPYLADPVDTPGAGDLAAQSRVDIFAPLSDREKVVAALLVTGLSYAQIARDLFVTRATVGFHLTRIYAKTGVTSRHQLIDLVHAAQA